MEELLEIFKKKYNEKDIRVVRSPLRICPLGAHSDHQVGFVTGMTLESSVNLVFSPSNDGYICTRSPRNRKDHRSKHLGSCQIEQSCGVKRN